MKQVRPVTIRNGRLIRMDEVSKGSIRFDDGRIVAVGAIDPHPEDEVIDARGKLVAPALVDYGVFAVDKAASHMGGIARVALMPDQTPPLDYPARVNFIAKSGKPDLWVHPFSAATSGLLGRELSEIALMREAGARGIATGRTWLADSGVMFRLLQYAAMLDEVVIVHAEDGGLAGPAVATAAEMASRQGLPSAPAEAEALAIARDLQLASMAAARLHIRQVTTQAGLDLVRSAKRAGIRVTAGVTPAHFALSELALAGFRSFARLSPPLRTESDRLAVREAIADGTIDVIASGHDPRNVQEKRLPFADAAPGMAGARTLLSLSLSLVRDGLVTLPQAWRMMATVPARLLGVSSGQLTPGFDADIVIVDPDAPWIVNDVQQKGAGNTPFDRQPMQGLARQLYKGGVPVAAEA